MVRHIPRFVLLMYFSLNAFSAVWHVDKDSTAETEDGLSWATSFRSIQAAIDAASADGGGEVWVAEGRYDEERTHIMEEINTGALLLRSGVDVYGGFAGTESTREERDFVNRIATLDGSASRNGTSAFHVVVGATGARLDGFTITGGAALGATGASSCGGGMLNAGSSPTVANCTFILNSGVFGGGMANEVGANPAITNCTFASNVGIFGGGMELFQASATITNCVFEGNVVVEDALGGGLFNLQSTTTIQGTTFTGNTGQRGAAINSQQGTLILSDSTFTGNATEGLSQAGGAIFSTVSAATLSSCTFVGNESESGGGYMGIIGSELTVNNSTFTGNVSRSRGAAINLDSESSATIEDSTFEANSGPAVTVVNAQATLRRCEFAGNSAPESAGAALDIEDSDVTIEDCTILDNEADGAAVAIGGFATPAKVTINRTNFVGNAGDIGGALSVILAADVDISECSFVKNRAGEGAGFAVFLGASVTLTNCIFAENQSETEASAFSVVQATVDVRNTTIAGNTNVIDSDIGGAAIFVSDDSVVVFTNSIVWDNFPFNFTLGPASDVTASFSVIQGGATGEGNLDADPKFIDSLHGDIRVRAASPAIDAGTAIPEVTSDIFGTPRPQGGAVDIGAYEFLDTDGDTAPDDWEVQMGLDPNDSADGTADDDGDGHVNSREYEMGTDPFDGSDPPDDRYVSISGSDETGDGGMSNRWRTIFFASREMSHYATEFHPATLHAAAGVYDEKVTMRPNLALVGESPETTTIQFFDAAVFEHLVVRAAANTALRNLTLSVPVVGAEDLSLLVIDGVSMVVDNVTFDGADRPNSTAIAISGEGASSSAIANSRVRAAETGIRSDGSAPNITRNSFTQITENAIEVLDSPGGLTPLLGDAEAPETTGFNQFAQVAGNFVANSSASNVQAEINDWGRDTESGIALFVNGAVDFAPWLNTRIGRPLLAVRVLDDANGAVFPQSAAPQVTISELGAVESPDPDSGLAIFDLSAGGSFTVEVSASGSVSETVNVTVLEGERKAVTVRLRAGDGPVGCAASSPAARPWGLLGDGLVLLIALVIIVRRRRAEAADRSP